MSSCQYGINVLGQTVCFDGIVDPIVSGVIDPIENFFSTLYSEIVNTLSSAVSTAASDIENFFSTAFTDVKNFFTGIFDDIKGFFNYVYNGLVSLINTVWNDIVSAVTTAYNDVKNFFTGIFDDIRNFFEGIFSSLTSLVNTVWNDLVSAFDTAVNDIKSFISSLFHNIVTTVESGLGDVKNFFSSVFNNIASYVETGFNDVKNGLTNVTQFIETSLGKFAVEFGTVVSNIGKELEKGLETLGVDLYNALKPVAEDILRGVEGIAHSVVQFLSSIPNSLIGMLQSFSRQSPEQVIARLVEFVSATVGTYVAITAGVKLIENIHPLHSLHVENFTDKVFEFLGFAEMVGAVQHGIVDYGFGKQLEYAMNYIARPKISDLALESVAYLYGYESEDELRHGLALEGYPDDLIEKFMKTIYKPINPFVLRYLIETGLVDHNFLYKQLKMEGFSPEDIPFIAKTFDALLLAPFQNQVKSFVYENYKSGFVDEGKARAIMNVFQIPRPQQEWILRIANEEFSFQQKQLLVQLVLDYLAKALITVEQCISALTGLGITQDRAKTQCTLRALSAAPPPPKSVRAELIQQVLKEAGLP